MEATTATHSSYQSSAKDHFIEAVVEGLSQQQKTLPSKFFYDTEGSRLFDDICNLDEYYPYHTELSILPRISNELGQLLNHPYDIVEFGAGSLIKIRLLLNQIEQTRHYVPIDIAGDHLQDACAVLKQDYDHLNIVPVVADITQSVTLPGAPSDRRLGFFPGSTIGNFTRSEAIQFLGNARRTLGDKSLLLIGVDTKKSPHILHQAYNDTQGVTAAFNQNILHRINREIGGNFNVELFHHYAFYNVNQSRIEMHLISQCDQQISVSGERFQFKEGESIHTENSHKYTTDEFRQLARKAGWQHHKTWTDDNQLFSVHLLEVA